MLTKQCGRAQCDTLLKLSHRHSSPSVRVCYLSVEVIDSRSAQQEGFLLWQTIQVTKAFAIAWGLCIPK